MDEIHGKNSKLAVGYGSNCSTWDPHQLVDNAVASDADQLDYRANRLCHFDVWHASNVQHKARMVPCVSFNHFNHSLFVDFVGD